MKFIRIAIFSATLLVSVFLSSALYAGDINSNAGTSVFSFLKVDIGARPMAMGGAFTGVADDESALFYNPAGVSSLEGRHFIAGYHNNFFDMQSGFLGYIHPIGDRKKVTLFINYLNYGSFIRTDNQGVEDGTTFSGGDFLVASGYAQNINERLQLGGTVKLIYESIDGFSASGLAVDLSARYSFNYGRTALGFMVQNLGTQLSTFVEGDKKESLPLAFRLGGSTRLKGLPVLLAADAVVPTDNDFYIAVGVEYLKARPLFIRLGWSSFGSQYKTGSSKDDFAGLSFGFGIEHKRMQISYTLTPQAELGTSHRITFTGGIN
jgi:hypothetical protein